MASTLTIEGSLTPSAFLARGERRRVQRTDRIDRLVFKGFVVVVDAETDEPEPTPLPEPVKAPKRNASREDWAEFLAEHTDVVTEGKDREELQEAYDEFVNRAGVPAAPQE